MSHYKVLNSLCATRKVTMSHEPLQVFRPLHITTVSFWFQVTMLQVFRSLHITTVRASPADYLSLLPILKTCPLGNGRCSTAVATKNIKSIISRDAGDALSFW